MRQANQTDRISSPGILKKINRTFWTDIQMLDRPWYINYGFALLFLSIATILKVMFFTYITQNTPFLLYFGVVILSARFAGVGPAIFSAIVSAIISLYYFLPPFESWQLHPVNIIQLSVYLLEGVLIAGFSGALSRADLRVRVSERRFRALIEKSADGIAMSRENAEVIYASPSIEEVLGFPPEEFLKLDALSRLHPEEKKDIMDKYAGIYSNPGSAATLLFRFLNKKGEWIWIESTLTNLLDDPAVNAIVSNFRNVTERILLEKQKEDFIGIATHELKTPVTSVKAYTQLMLQRFRKEENDKAAELVERMDNQLNRLIGLINDLLDVTRIQSGSLPFVSFPYNFNKMVTEIVEDLQRTTDQHKIEMDFKDNIEMIGDKERVSQVLTNLIANAIKYSPQSKIINVTVAKKNMNAEVCVEDQGLGLDKDVHSKVFERFYRVSGPGNKTFPGLGLGLYISSEIIKRQGGRIWVQSEKGKGSTFCFSLPLQHKIEQ